VPSNCHDSLSPLVTGASQDVFDRVRVVQDLPRDPLSPFRKFFGAAGESRAAWPLGGRGGVSFTVLAGNAISYASPQETRSGIVAAIGRGVGRAAAHEFAHQFLPTSDIHASRDVRSYEYATAWRAEQYYGALHWHNAWPLLVRRFGAAASGDRDLPAVAGSR
jgi:hypothetical protein